MEMIDKDTAAYEEMQDELEKEHFGEWAVFYDGEFVGTYPTHLDAVRDAVDRYERGPYLIREVGAPPVVSLPYMAVVPDDGVDLQEFRAMYAGNLDGVPEDYGAR